MMKAMYEGPEGEVTIFGLAFPRGVPVEVTDPHACAKLANHPEFIVDDEASDTAEAGIDQPKRRGRPPKVRDPS